MKLSMNVTIELQETGDFDTMSTVIPQRASRQTADVEQEYDDTLNATPRSQVRFRPTQTDDVETQPLVECGNRITGKSRVLLYMLLILCIAFLVSGINSPMLQGNVIVIHVPMVWIVAGVAILVSSVALIRR